MAGKKKKKDNEIPIKEKLFKKDDFINADDDNDDFVDEFDDEPDWDDDEVWEGDAPVGHRLDIHVNVNINVNSAAELDKYEKSVKRIFETYFMN